MEIANKKGTKHKKKNNNSFENEADKIKRHKKEQEAKLKRRKEYDKKLSQEHRIDTTQNNSKANTVPNMNTFNNKQHKVPNQQRCKTVTYKNTNTNKNTQHSYNNNNKKSKSTYTKRNEYQIPEHAKPKPKHRMEEEDNTEQNEEEDTNQKHLMQMEQLVTNGQNQKVDEFRRLQNETIQLPKYVNTKKKLDVLLVNKCEVSFDELNDNDEDDGEEGEETKGEENKEVITENAEIGGMNDNNEVVKTTTEKMNDNDYSNNNEERNIYNKKNKRKQHVDSHEYMRKIKKCREFPTRRDTEDLITEKYSDTKNNTNDVGNSFRQSSRGRSVNASSQKRQHVGTKHHYHDDENNFLFSHSPQVDQPTIVKDYMRTQKQRKRKKEEEEKQKQTEKAINTYKNLNELQNAHRPPNFRRDARVPAVKMRHHTTENLSLESSTEIDAEECIREIDDVKHIIAIGDQPRKDETITKEGYDDFIRREEDEIREQLGYLDNNHNNNNNINKPINEESNTNTETSLKRSLHSVNEMKDSKKKIKEKHVLEEEFIKKIDNTIKNAGENVKNVRQFIRSSSSRKQIQEELTEGDNQDQDQIINSIETEHKQTTENENEISIQDNTNNNNQQDDYDEKLNGPSIKVPSTLGPSNVNSIPQQEMYEDEDEDNENQLVDKVTYLYQLLLAIYKLDAYRSFLENVSSYIETKENYDRNLSFLCQTTEDFILLQQYKFSYITMMSYMRKKYIYSLGIERLIFVIKFYPLNEIVSYYNYVSYLTEMKKIVAPFKRAAFIHFYENIYNNDSQEEYDEQAYALEQERLMRLDNLFKNYRLYTVNEVFQLFKQCDMNAQFQQEQSQSQYEDDSYNKIGSLRNSNSNVNVNAVSPKITEYSKVRKNFIENNNTFNLSVCSCISAQTIFTENSAKNSVITDKDQQRLNKSFINVFGKPKKSKSKQRKPFSTKMLKETLEQSNIKQHHNNPFATPSPSSNKEITKQTPTVSEPDPQDISAEKDDIHNIDEWHSINKPDSSRERSGSEIISPQSINPFQDTKNNATSSIGRKQSDGEYSNDDSAYDFTDNKLDEGDNSLDIEAIRNEESIPEQIHLEDNEKEVKSQVTDKEIVSESPIKEEITKSPPSFEEEQIKEDINNNSGDGYTEGINVVFSNNIAANDNNISNKNNRYAQDIIDKDESKEQPISIEETSQDNNNKLQPTSKEEVTTIDEILTKNEQTLTKPFVIPAGVSEEEFAESIANDLLMNLIQTEIQKPSKPLLHKKHSSNTHKLPLDSSASLQSSIVSSGSVGGSPKLTPTLSNIAHITAQLTNPNESTNSIFMRTLREKKRERNLNLYNEKIAPEFINLIEKKIDTNYNTIIDQLSIPYKINGENLMNKILLRDESIQNGKLIFENQNDINNNNFISTDLIKEFEPTDRKLRNEESNANANSYYDNILNECLIDAANEIISKERKYGSLGEPLPWSVRTREVGFKYGRDVNSKRKLQTKVKKKLEALVETKMGLIQENHEYLDKEQIVNDREKKFIESIKEELVEEDEHWKVFEKDETQIKLLLSKIVMEQLLSEVVEILEHVQLSRRDPAKYQSKSIYACEDIPRLSFQNTTEINTTNEENDSINQ